MRLTELSFLGATDFANRIWHVRRQLKLKQVLRRPRVPCRRRGTKNGGPTMPNNLARKFDVMRWIIIAGLTLPLAAAFLIFWLNGGPLIPASGLSPFR